MSTQTKPFVESYRWNQQRSEIAVEKQSPKPAVKATDSPGLGLRVGQPLLT